MTSFAAVPPAAGTGRAQARGAQWSHAVTALIAVACVLSASASAAQTIVPVSTEAQLRSAVAALASNTTIVLAPGTYTLGETLTVTGPLTDVTIRGATGNRDDVVIVGPGMDLAADTLHAIQTVGAVTRLTVSDLSIKEFPGSCVFIGAEASSPRVRNVHLMNAGKSFVDTASTVAGAAAGIVEYSLIEFVAPALAKTSSMGGVHIKGGANWVVRGNTFRRIWFAGEPGGPALAAILSNFSSSRTLAENNTIVDCQRGISFGSTDVEGRFEHVQGIIRNNVIYRSGLLQHLGSGGDVGIHVADSPGTRVAHNTVLQGDGYDNAIEYRYPATDAIIQNNLVDKRIHERDNATATLTNNYTSATAAMFVNAAGADLHLVKTATAAINAGAAVTPDDGLQDFDGQQRPLSGTLPDIGADEFGGVAPAITTSSALPTGVVGFDYSQAIASSLDSDSYPAWTFVAGQLPPGLGLSQPGLTSAQVAGVPTSAGTYHFRVRVIDVFDGSYAEKTFVLSMVSPGTVTTVSQVSSTVSQVCGAGPYTAEPYPLYERTFSYSIPAGYDISHATVSGTWGSSCFPNSTAGVDVRLAGLMVAQCVHEDPGCWLDQAAGLPPRPWTAAVSSSLFRQLATGSASLTAQQTSPSFVQLGPTTLDISLVPRTVTATVGTNVPGASFTVDGRGFTSTTAFSWVVGSAHTIATTTPQGTGATRYAFSNWSDGGAINHEVTTPAAGGTYTAHFTTQQRLTTAVSPSGSGTVTPAPASADGFYNSATVVQLTPAPAAGYVFANWSGSCAGTGACSVTMTAPRSVTANFAALYTLTVTKAGTGSGTVTSVPAGIGCGTDCTESYASGTAATLTATPAAGSRFGGWSGSADCSDGAVTLTAARTCQATFILTDQVTGIVRVTPAAGPLAGGTVITITGANFQAGAVVSVGEAVATSVVVLSPTTITAVTSSATTVGAREVVVSTSGGTASLPGGFTYVAEMTGDVLDDESPLPPGSDFLQPALNADGRYLAYVVTSDAVITGDSNGVPDVVVRDRVAGTVTRVSVAGDGGQSNGPSGRPRISESGQYVAFWSEASNLVASDTNGVRDVFLHDRDADGNGVFDETAAGARTTVRVSVASNGTQGDAASALDGDPLVTGVASDGQLDLSPDGLWVAYTSRASTLVPDDTNAVADIFLRSVTGQDTTRVSVAADGTEADGASQSPGVSAGAQRVVFASSATNLVPGDTNGLRDVFLIVRATGQVVRLSETVDGGNADGASDTPSIDDAGQTVAFATRAKNLVPALASSATAQIVVATLKPSTAVPAQASVAAGAQALRARRLAADDVINITDVLKQLASGALPPGTATVQPGDGASTQPEVCGNGTCVGYATAATNLTPEAPDTNGVPDVVRQPVVTVPPAAPPPVERLSTDVEGNPGTEPSTRIALSENGGVVAMQSAAALTPQAGAVNSQGTNVFVRAVPVVVATMIPVAAQVDQPTTVTLTGTGFQAGAVVLFGTVAGGGAASADGRTLTVITPTEAQGVAPGVVPVTVRNPNGSTVSLFQEFTFLPKPGTTPTTDTDADGLPDAWEVSVGLNPQSASGADGASGDPDVDGQTNLDEYQAKTHPRGTFTRYLAEGATSTFFITTIGLANSSATQAAHAWLRFQKSDGTQVPLGVEVPPLQARMVTVNTLAGLENTAFATVVESDAALAVQRTMTWDPGRGYGSHLETAVLAPAPRWYLAEGSTRGGFQLFYLIQNPGTTAADVEVRFLLPSGAPVVKTYTVAAGSRFNVWVNTIPELASTDCSAVVTAITGGPIIVERAMYLDGANGLLFGAGHESAGVTAPALTWFLAEGATGPFFDLFVLVANPGETAAELEVTYLLPDGTTLVKPYLVAPNSRFNIWVDLEDARLADTAVSTTVRATNGVPVLVERAMWWPGPGWYEGHNSFGATQTGTQWAFGTGEITGAPKFAATYVLVANTAAWDATVAVTVLFEDGTPSVTRTFGVRATSRFNVDVGFAFPEAVGKRFGVVVESVAAGGQAAAQIVVEGALYHNDTNGVVWAAGANALATRLR